MSYSDPYTSSPYDQKLADTSALTWVPWVGENYANLPEGRKILIVAESHYSNEHDPEKIHRSLESILNERSYTRAVVSESLVNGDWTTRTLSTMHQLFYSPRDRRTFWGDVAFYNIIQKPMWFRPGNPERPTWQDFWKGWEAFVQVIEILKPDHVLFIGVEATNHFNNFMNHHNREHVRIEWSEKIGSAYARTAQLSVGEKQIPLHFIKHCGSYFSTDRWSDYLHRNAGELMASLAISANAAPPNKPAPRLHVLGMAKSSLDLRGAKAPKLELDFLRLAYAVRELREADEEAIGYLMVLSPLVAKTVEGWREKYATGESVVILCEEIQGENLEALIKEKADNAIGFIQDRRFAEAEYELSLADLGKTLGETALLRAIEQRHPGLVSAPKPPLGINWDYYGTQTTETLHVLETKINASAP